MGHQRTKVRRRVSSNTARHSKKVEGPAKLWSAGGLIGVCELTCLCLCLCLLVLGPRWRRSKQPASGHGERPQSPGMWLAQGIYLFIWVGAVSQYIHNPVGR